MDYDHFKSVLINKRKDVEETLTQVKNTQEGDYKLSYSELSNYDNHPAELASELFQTEFNNGLIVHEEDIISKIDSALKRIDNKTYGICKDCGKEIPEGRLEVLPYAELCIDCKNTEEKYNDMVDNRPNEEKVIDAPFGRKYLNKKEDDEYEGLDYLNDLVKYGSSDTPQDMGGYEEYDEFYTNKIDKQGIVDEMDNISNEDFEDQLPD